MTHYQEGFDEMSGRARIKVPINSDILRSLIKKQMSIIEAGPEIGYGEQTVRRGLSAGELPIEVVILLGNMLGVDPKEFADFDGYLDRLLKDKDNAYAS